MFKIIGMTKLIWKLFKIVLTLLLAFLMYVVIGGVVPFLHHPDVSQTKKEAVESTQFYSDSAGPDRATIIEDNEEALKMRLRVTKRPLYCQLLILEVMMLERIFWQLY